jgi:hypothetical protein
MLANLNYSSMYLGSPLDIFRDTFTEDCFFDGQPVSETALSGKNRCCPIRPEVAFRPLPGKESRRGTMTYQVAPPSFRAVPG